MNKNAIRNKQKTLQSAGCLGVISDILRYCDQVSGTGEQSQQEYVRSAMMISDYLNGSYIRLLKSEPKKQKVRQVDLEDSIREIKQEQNAKNIDNSVRRDRTGSN